MRSALVLCDVEDAPADWSRHNWDETMSVRRNGESPSLWVGLDSVDAAGVGLSARAWDLVTIASYIYAADQEVIRWTEKDVYGLRWKRDMHLVVPVVAPEFWNQPAILEPLRDTLSYVSGDSWDFRFVSGGGRYASRFQLRDPGPSTADSVILFSGGADSLSAVVRELAQEKHPILVSQRAGTPFSGQLDVLRKELRHRFSGWELPHYSAEVNRLGSDAKENTQRTRSFLYGCLGAAVANAEGIRQVWLSDNGIVSINLGPNRQLVGTLSSRSTHAGFLRRLNSLLQVVFDVAPSVDNSLWNLTRAEALGALKATGLGSLLEETRSCAHPRFRTKMQPHCGRCSQCIDRRFGGIAAGLAQFDPAWGYELDIFRQALPVGEAKTLAVSTVNFARTVLETPTERLFNEFPELDESVSRNDPLAAHKATEIAALLHRHATEVLSVIEGQLAASAADLAARSLPADSLLCLVAAGEREAVVASASPTPTSNAVQLRGRAWLIRFNGETSAASDTKGMRDLIFLLEHPNEPVSAVQLYREAEHPNPVSTGEAVALGLAHVANGDSAVADDQAIESYRQEIVSIDEDIEEARANHDLEREARLQDSKEPLIAEVIRRFGRHAKVRLKRTREEEKARKAVRSRVDDAFEQLESALPQLATHLRKSVRLGLLCSYQAAATDSWHIDRS